MGCFVYCVLGTAKDITLGPTAIMSLMTAEFGGSWVHYDATVSIILTLFCGITQLVMGLLNIGKFQTSVHSTWRMSELSSPMELSKWTLPFRVSRGLYIISCHKQFYDSGSHHHSLWTNKGQWNKRPLEKFVKNGNILPSSFYWNIPVEGLLTHLNCSYSETNLILFWLQLT